MNLPNWLLVALQISGAVAIFIPLFLFVFSRGKRQADVSISKTEAEVYKTLVENKLSDLNINEIIEKKVEQEVTKFKDMLWDAQKAHYEVKVEMQERQIKTLKERNEIEQENEMLKNELQEVREEYQSCLRQIELLRNEVAELKKKK